MYLAHFGLTEAPFTITPDPRYLFMSDQHREAMAHLTYGVNQGGGFVQLTGEVGTGKTTICRCMLSQLPADVDVALITNPRISELELLATLCDELRIEYPEPASSKVLLDRLNQRLLEAHAAGRRTVLIIDEAQNLSRQVLERVRLLTNLETAKEKLLQIILIGQPELTETLGRPDLRQLAQRITARYHLAPLTAAETGDYIAHRLTVAGCKSRVFTRSAVRDIYRRSNGVPRIINVICDRALLGAYAANEQRVDSSTVRQSITELYGEPERGPWMRRFAFAALAVVALGALGLVGANTGVIERLRSSDLLAVRINSSETTPVTPPPAPAPVANADMPAEVEPVAESAPVPPPVAGLVEIEQDAAPRPISAEVPAADAKTGGIAPLPNAQEVASLAPNAEPGTVSKLSAALEADAAARELPSAFSRLAGLWGIGLEEGDGSVCDRALKAGLKCLNANGSWDNLRRFDRPALLAIKKADAAEKRQYVLVRDLDRRSARLIVGAREFRVDLDEIDAMWTGDFVMLWRPPTRNTLIKRGSNGDDVLWLRRAMNFIASNGGAMTAGTLDNPDFDDELETQVRQFQEQYRLKERGVVGAETLIALNSRLDADMPRLQRY